VSGIGNACQSLARPREIKGVGLSRFERRATSARSEGRRACFAGTPRVHEHVRFDALFETGEDGTAGNVRCGPIKFGSGGARA